MNSYERKKNILRKLLCLFGHSSSLSAVEHWAYHNPDIDISIFCKGYLTDRKGDLLCAWDVEHDDIDFQSEETVNFIYDLIVNRRITSNNITDPQILLKYKSFLEKLAQITKLVEQGICPECGRKLDEPHGGGKDCFNCGWSCA